MTRDILHVDMDAFYAAIEQRDHPELLGKPVVVGAAPGGRGVVSAASYEARRFGVRSAMPISQAKRLCPDAAFMPVNMARYCEVSRQVMAILDHYTPLVEPVSVDEAFLDVTGSRRLFGEPRQIGLDIKRRTREELGLTASVGIAPNKFLAKVASDLKKPDGLVIVEAGNECEFLWPLPISRLWGVGKATEERLRHLGIGTVGQLAGYAADVLERQFGEPGRHLYALAHGLDDRPVVPDQEAKSVSSETTFQEDTRDLEQLESTLLWLSEQVAGRMRKAGLRGRTVQLKLRSGDFTTITRSRTLPAATDATDTLYQTARELFRKAFSGERRCRLIGVGLHNFGEPQQQSLFGDDEATHSPLDEALDRVRERYGPGGVVRGRLVREE